MRITAISDTHNKLKKLSTLPGGDVLSHSGDLTLGGNLSEMQRELKELGILKEKFKYKHCIYVAGNHDWEAEKNPTLIRSICEDNGIIYLQDEEVNLEGVRFYGSPQTPRFNNWAFNRYRGEDIKRFWDKIPRDGINYLITHGPPYGILDEVLRVDGSSRYPREMVGCEDLWNAVMEVKPKVHQFGHIHCSSGEKEFMGVKFINASLCDELYMLSNPVREIEI